MKPTKPNRTRDVIEFDPQPIPYPGLALECVPAREERRFHSFLFFGTHALTQCSRDAEQIGGSAHLVGHA